MATTPRADLMGPPAAGTSLEATGIPLDFGSICFCLLTHHCLPKAVIAALLPFAPEIHPQCWDAQAARG